MKTTPTQPVVKNRIFSGAIKDQELDIMTLAAIQSYFCFNYQLKIELIYHKNTNDTMNELGINHLNIIDSLETFDAKLQYLNILRKLSYPFKEESDPEAWIQRLVYAPNPNSKQIIKFIKAAFGINMICKDQSILMDNAVIVIDAISDFVSINEESDKVIAETMLGLIQTSIEQKNKF